MDTLRVWAVLLLGMFMVSMSGQADAQGGHGGHGGYYRHGGHSNVGVGIMINPFWFGPWQYPSSYYYSPYYYSPYYYPPAVVAVPATPPVYIERGEVVEPVPQASASWYYCAEPQGYYPTVEQCPGGWQAVAPRPPAAQDDGR